jgi:hypothetical protein
MKALNIEDELLTYLCVHACGTADAPTLVFVSGFEDALVEDALAALLCVGEVERVGVAFRITDAGRARLNGRPS